MTNTTVTTHQLYVILLIVSCLPLFILWILILQQCCITKISDKQRLIRTLLLFIFSIFAIFLNLFVYLSSLYPNFYWSSSVNVQVDLAMTSHIIEAVALIIGFHIGRIVMSSMISEYQSNLGYHPPIWVKTILYTFECFIMISILTCYLFIFIFNHDIYRYCFYIIMSMTIIIEALCILYIMIKLLKILNAVRLTKMNDKSDKKLKSATHSIKIAVLFLILICIICCGFILMSFEVLYNFMNIIFNKQLIDNILHSLLLIAVVSFYLWWIYESNKFCIIKSNTITFYCGCADFWVYYCPCCCDYDRNYHRNQFNNIRDVKTAILLEDSSVKKEKKTITPFTNSSQNQKTNTNTTNTKTNTKTTNTKTNTKTISLNHSIQSIKNNDI